MYTFLCGLTYALGIPEQLKQLRCRTVILQNSNIGVRDETKLDANKRGSIISFLQIDSDLEEAALPPL